MLNGTMLKRTVLVVDDEPSHRGVLTCVLMNAFAVTQIDNARDAVRLLRQHQPDIVVLNLVPPGMNGHVAHLIKAHHPETAILAVSAPPGSKFSDSNIDAALAPPFDRNELLDIVQTLCPEEWTNADESIW